MKNKILISIFIALFTFVVVPAAALAVPPPTEKRYYFTVINANPPADVKAAVERQMYVDIKKLNGSASFTFYNNNLLTADPNMYFSATSLYFMDLPPILNESTAAIGTQTGSVSYQQFDPDPSNGLPEGNVIAFQTTGLFDPTSPAPANGIEPDQNPMDSLQVKFDFMDDWNIQKLFEEIDNGTKFDIGMKVQSFTVPGFNGGSLAIHLGNGPIGSPGAVPEPATMLLLGTGLVGIAGTVRRRKKMQK